MGWRRHLGRFESPSPSQIKPDDDIAQTIKAFKNDLILSTTDYTPTLDIQNLPTYTPEEVAKHDGKKTSDTAVSDTWLVIGNKVYDVTTFMMLEHPGGKDVIEAFAGKQCDWQFDLFHHPRHLKEFEDQLLIGHVFPVPQNPFPKPAKELKADWRVE